MLNHAVICAKQCIQTSQIISKCHRLLIVCEKSHFEITKQIIIPLGFFNAHSVHKDLKSAQKILHFPMTEGLLLLSLVIKLH